MYRYCAEGTSHPGSVACPRGHYCDRATPAPVPCPAGRYTEEEGAVGIEFCKSCPTGHYCTEGTASPMPCAPGTYNPMLDGDTELSCSPCLSGMSCTEWGLSWPNYACSPGYYCPGGNFRPNQTEYACPPGTYTDFHNLTAVEQCSSCPETYACLLGTGGQQKPPTACARGHYCPRGTETPTQFPCAAGSWTNKTNLKEQSECEQCPRGYYCLQGSSEPTGLCFQGHWCPLGKSHQKKYNI